MYKLVNVMETLVLDTLDEVLRDHRDICGCERCRLDMAAIVLNRMPPSYVVTLEGEIRYRTNALRQQCRVDIFRFIAEAAKIVSRHPHHSRRDE